jgi:phage-related minor tail protein
MNGRRKASPPPMSDQGEQGEGFAKLEDDAESTAQRIAEAFAEAGEAISGTLEAAALSGSLSFSNMAESILQDLARIALELVVAEPLSSLGEQLGQSVAGSIGGILGQRQDGGPVLGGAPYLVGEQGPEVFVPNTSGAIVPTGPAQVINITIQAQGDAVSAVQRSERQITAAIARAAAAGGRLL